VLASKQVAALESVQSVPIDGETFETVGFPFRFGGAPTAVGAAAPHLGQHSRQILRELGFGADEIVQFETHGVVVSPPEGRGLMARDLSAIADEVVARTREICRVPGPPLDEADRAATVRSWWAADGLADLHSDATGNLWARARAADSTRGEASGAGAIVVAAHLDTVFGRAVTHETRTVADRLIGPGVGDDSVALAALGAVAELLPPGSHRSNPVWLLADRP